VARTPLRRGFATSFVVGLVVWSCASNPGPATGGDSGGNSSAGSAGAPAGNGGVGGSPQAGGVAGNQAGGGQGAAASGSGGSATAGTGQAGTQASGVGGDPEGGTAGSAEAGPGEGGAPEAGAGGSAEPATFEGVCGQGWAAGSSAPAPKLRGNVTPEVDRAGNWSFAFGRYRLVIAAAHGARVIEFSIDGVNLIDQAGGSTFWPSPQQAYTWPPPTEIDSDAYAAEADATSLSLTSDVSKALGLSVRKRFWVNASSGVVSIEYQLVNESKLSASWAPWEVTRVRAGGYTFAPKGPGNRNITQDSFQHPLPLTLLPPAPAAGGIEWLNYAKLSLTQDNYINEFDGAEGWLAHANRLGKGLLPVLFVKSFVDAADASLPTNQAEIQLWTSGTANPKLIEVEQQGALQVLAAGDALTWTVHWSACELDGSVELSAGSADLAALARAHAIKL
jgi:hypothetical protein